MKLKKKILLNGLRMIEVPMADNPTVTVRDRDTGEQKRMQISDLTNYIKSAIL